MVLTPRELWMGLLLNLWLSQRKSWHTLAWGVKKMPQGTSVPLLMGLGQMHIHAPIPSLAVTPTSSVVFIDGLGQREFLHRHSLVAACFISHSGLF